MLPYITEEANGVALVSLEDAAAFATAGVYLAEGELGAVVVGSNRLPPGNFTVEQITFTACHGTQKVLLKGTLVNLGKKMVSLRQSIHRVELEFQNLVTLTVEIRKEYVTAWDTVQKNPLPYVWTVVDGLQRHAASTWARKWFSGRRESSPELATTWHCFTKIPEEHLEPILLFSGRGGVFLSPRDGPGSQVSGRYRVVWLEHADVEKAATLQRTYPEIVGLVRGRDSLGFRVKASDYSTTRRKLDPHWSAQGLLTDIVIETRWTLDPLPPQTDKTAVQKILNQLSWRAVPLKQLSATAWVVGCMEKDHPPTDVFQFADKPVLVSKQGTKVSRAPEDVVLAAPPAVKKALGVQISRGTWRTPAAMAPDTQMDSSQPGPMRSLLAEFRDEVNARFGDFQAQIQGAVNHVNEKVGGLESQVPPVPWKLLLQWLHAKVSCSIWSPRSSSCRPISQRRRI